MKLNTGSTIDTFTRVEANQVKEVDSKEGWAEFPNGGDTVPGHLQRLYDAGKGSCRGTTESQTLAGLLTRYNTVCCTVLVEHTILVMEGIRPGHLPPHRLMPEKEA